MSEYSYDYGEDIDDYEEEDDLDESLGEYGDESLISSIPIGEEDDLEEDVMAEEAEDFAELFAEAPEGRRSRRKAARRRAAAARAAKARRVGAAKANKSFRARLAKTYVTQPQLQATSARLDRKIAINARAVKKVNARVNAVKAKQARDYAAIQGRLDRHTIAIRKEQATRKAADEKLGKDLQMAMLMPMMMQPTPVTTTSATGGIPSGTTLATVQDDSMSMMLPLMLMGGGEGSSGDNSMMMLVLAMSMMNSNKS